MTRPTLLDIAKKNLSDAEVGLISEALYNTPEVTGVCPWTRNTVPGVGQVKGLRGLNYYTRVRTALPTVGFRGANEGVDPAKSTYENRLIESFILNPRWECDKMVADADEDGPEAYIAEEADAVLKAAFLQLAKQFYYGTNTTYGGHAKGFPGLLDHYDSTNMVIDAGGTTDDIASSAWLVKWGTKETRWVLGNNSQLAVSDVRIETIKDSDSKSLTGYVQELLCRIGLQIGNPVLSVCRIKKLTTDSGKGLTDALISRAIALMKIRPDAMFMTRRSWGQLQSARTATTDTGREAPFPTDVHGVPIMITDALSNTEKLAL
jgi:hypothetical protein